jgi:hypothetical protein
VALEVAGQPSVAADPSNDAIRDSLLWRHNEAVAVAAAHELLIPRGGAGNGDGHLRPGDLKPVAPA